MGLRTFGATPIPESWIEADQERRRIAALPENVLRREVYYAAAEAVDNNRPLLPDDATRIAGMTGYPVAEVEKALAAAYERRLDAVETCGE